MPLIARSTDKPSEQIPVGTQQAVCAFVQDIGTHETNYQGQARQRHQVVIVWELAKKMEKGDNAGKPFVISKFYTFSLGKKANLAKDIESWFSFLLSDKQRKEGFDLERLVGKNCLLSVVSREGKEYRDIAAIMPLPSGMPTIPVTLKEVPAWIDEKRKESIEYRAEHATDFGDEPPVAASITDDIDPSKDDLPF